uniref:Uracil-DNA glycosylase n=1 Tax=Setaria digitata TaxID=48799 RepID=A0A915PKN9_9BILA
MKNNVPINKTSVVKTARKCGDLMSWLKRNEETAEKEIEANLSLVEKKGALESGKGNIGSTSSAEYLRSLVEDVGWRRVLMVEFRKDYMDRIVKFLKVEKGKGVKIFPPQHQIFNAFNLTPLNRIRVVIIGQDPYHDDNQAHGLCFSVCKGIRLPPSLVNIYKELKTDIPNFKIPNHGCLESWAQQGVFMLNATLTVEAHRPNSHNHIGWQKFTDEVIRIISRDCRGVVFLLWGGFAHKKEYIIDKKKHVIIKTAHPSPLSARLFFGCKCFSRTNEALAKLGRPPIDWGAF